MLIRIINGTYGHRQKLANGELSNYIVPVTRNDPPIEVEETEAARLVAAHVAVYVNAVNATGAAGAGQACDSDSSTRCNSVEARDGESGDFGPGEVATDVDELKSMSVAALKKMAADMGIDAAKLRTKASLIDAICAEAEESSDEAPVLDAEDVVE